ncbi:pyruvate carboxylase [Aureococcus anophagefferens]|nr:pyruvate carboxylase [Aureococcus anophagefferens]
MAAAPRRTSTFGEAGPLGADKSPDPTVPQPDGVDGGGEEGEELFGEVCSKDFLGFGFGGRSYGDQLLDAVKKTKQHCAVRVRVRSLAPSGVAVVWVQHDFAFLGGSLGCAEGERVARAFELATERRLCVVVACRTGGARMQEGTLSLMQMAKVSVAVAAHRRSGLPFVSVLEDPTYGGVSASYAMQADVKVAVAGARIGFAGPGVILNTMFDADEANYDAACPAEFQSAEYCLRQGAVDVVAADAAAAAELAAHNYGMPSPAGYRTALKLFRLAERFGLPVVTFVDTCGAWPSFEAEGAGQSEAIATNLTAMAGLAVPIITVVLGEGGSGGALGIAMGNRVAMLSQAYYGVISPEGAASILGRYADDDDKKARFPADCQALAEAQGIYAHQLEKLGVVDAVLVEAVGETAALVADRHGKYRALQGRAGSISASSFRGRAIISERSSAASGRVPGLARRRRGPAAPAAEPPKAVENAKTVLDRSGPEAMAAWVRSQSRVLVTDTTMRDAHQSLLATRVRTLDLVRGARVASALLPDAFSFECWGGATFDVSYRFLKEDPWDRLRALRAAAPNVCTQMLIRGANAVGYTSYPDNVVTEFVRLAALNGMDVFRIFDCFNDVGQMRTRVDAVRAAGKVAEVCVCYTSDCLASDVYDVAYYAGVAAEAAAAGAHLIGIKDMAGLLKPAAAAPLLAAIRGVCDLPVHFHTHCTSSASVAVALEMTRAGCDVVDFATAAMADLTSQPSLNAFCAAMEGLERAPGIDYMRLEPYDVYWAKVRAMYAPFETGMLAGSARVFDHEIPGGQYANLFVQCQSMGLADRWEEVLDAYRDVNKLFGDVVKVTPSSKCVGDLALYLVTRKMTAADVLDGSKTLDYPDSVVGLMEGRLGFPHRGFPADVQQAILGDRKPLTTRPSAALAPADFGAEAARLAAAHGRPLDAERTMASVLYPKVFDDFMRFCVDETCVSVYLPTPVYLHGLAMGQTARLASLPAPLAKLECGVDAVDAVVDVDVTLKRVGPLKAGRMRTLVFDVNGAEQRVEVKNPAPEGEFDGPMADAGDAAHVAAPMPGAVDKVLAADGAAVAAGDDLCVVSAMKMEVAVKCHRAGTLALKVDAGAKVVEGALLATIN